MLVANRRRFILVPSGSVLRLLSSCALGALLCARHPGLLVRGERHAPGFAATPIYFLPQLLSSCPLRSGGGR